MMQKFYCKYCGTYRSSVASLTSGKCPRHPAGNCKGPHVLYQGSEKPQYTCQYCGTKRPTIQSLTSGRCPKHPAGSCKGYHSPAL